MKSKQLINISAALVFSLVSQFSNFAHAGPALKGAIEKGATAVKGEHNTTNLTREGIKTNTLFNNIAPGVRSAMARTRISVESITNVFSRITAIKQSRVSLSDKADQDQAIIAKDNLDGDKFLDGVAALSVKYYDVNEKVGNGSALEQGQNSSKTRGQQILEKAKVAGIDGLADASLVLDAQVALFEKMTFAMESMSKAEGEKWNKIISEIGIEAKDKDVAIAMLIVLSKVAKEKGMTLEELLRKIKDCI